MAAVVVLGACGHHDSGPKENDALFLTLNHVPLAGELASKPDAELLSIGHRACRDLDAGQTTDQVVADLAGPTAEPGSGAFNAYAYVAATAARELCPKHAGAFSGTGSILDGGDNG